MESAWRHNAGSINIEGWLLMNSVTDSCFEIILCHYGCVPYSKYTESDVTISH